MYEIKRALKKTLNDRNKAIQEMEEYQGKLIANNISWDIVNIVGKVIAGFKLDAKTELELIRQINRQIDMSVLCHIFFIELMVKYMKEGVDTYFDLIVINEEPTSTVRKQTVVLKNCNFDEVYSVAFNIDSDPLDEDMSFTFDNIDLLDKFKKPILR